MSRACLLFALVPVLLASPLTAQTEIGLEGGIVIEDQDNLNDNRTIIALPFQNVRVAFWTSDVLAVEFQTAFSRQSAGGSSLTQLGFDGGLRYRLGDWDWEAVAPFVRGGVGLNYLKVSDADGLTQLSLTLGGGADFPLAEPLALRLEGRFERGFENDRVAAANRFGLLLGLMVVLD